MSFLEDAKSEFAAAQTAARQQEIDEQADITGLNEKIAARVKSMEPTAQALGVLEKHGFVKLAKTGPSRIPDNRFSITDKVNGALGNGSGNRHEFAYELRTDHTVTFTPKRDLFSPPIIRPSSQTYHDERLAVDWQGQVQWPAEGLLTQIMKRLLLENQSNPEAMARLEQADREISEIEGLQAKPAASAPPPPGVR